MAANAFGVSWASVVISRDTVGSEATDPKTPGSARSWEMSEALSPPMAIDIARSNMILPGSWVANGLRHRDNPLVRALSRPTFSAVRSSMVAPACDTTPEPVPSTARDGYDVDLLTRKVLLAL